MIVEEGTRKVSIAGLSVPSDCRKLSLLVKIHPMHENLLRLPLNIVLGYDLHVPLPRLTKGNMELCKYVRCDTFPITARILER